LKEGGVMLCKVWQGSRVKDFKQDVKDVFERVAEHRPKATRKESRELFIYASHFKIG
jgi:23S rRNA (uridine2552-2'-O)-methyltransferase